MNFPRLLSLPPDLSPQLRSNIIHYFFDIGWWGLYAGATASFLTIYAARIGATPAQIGLLTALPSGVMLALSLPFGGVVTRMGAHRATWVGALTQRSLFLLYALLPFFLSEPSQVTAILVIALVLTAPTTLIGIGFNQLLMEALTPDWRGAVIGARNAIFSIITFIVTVISGQILTRMTFPYNYQVVFVIGFVGAVATAFHLWKVRPLPELAVSAAPVIPPEANRPVRRVPRYLPALGSGGRRYIQILLLLFLFNATNNMVTPLVPGLLVNTLDLSDAWISAGTAANSLIIFIISLVIAVLTRRSGNRGATALGAVLLAAQAVILAFASGPGLYILSVIAGGLGSGILLTAQYNYHLENVPENDRATWLSWNLFLGNGALLLGALIGPQIASLTGDPLALAIFGALRLLMALVILRWG